MKRFPLERGIPIVLLVVIALGPILFFWIPAETTKWKVAAALEAKRNGDAETATKSLYAISEANPENLLVQMTYLKVLSESGDQEETKKKIQELDKILPQDLNWAQQKSNAFHNIGLHERAYQLHAAVLAESEKRAKKNHEAFPNLFDAPTRNIAVWNNLTYFSSLAENTKETQHNLAGLQAQMGPQWEMEFLRARCLALTQVDKGSLALKLLNDKIPSYRKIYESEQKSLSKNAYSWITMTKWHGDEEPKEIRKKRLNVAVMRRGLRELAHLQVDLLRNYGGEDETQDAIANWEENFQFENLDQPSESPSVRAICNALRDRAVYLDTRGYARLKISMWNQALRDLDSAIEAADLVTALQEKAMLFNTHQEVDRRDIETRRNEFLKSKAIYHYHRSLIHRRKKNQGLEQLDRKIVKSLGFEPNEQLF